MLVVLFAEIELRLYAHAFVIAIGKVNVQRADPYILVLDSDCLVTSNELLMVAGIFFLLSAAVILER